MGYPLQTMKRTSSPSSPAQPRIRDSPARPSSPSRTGGPRSRIPWNSYAETGLRHKDSSIPYHRARRAGAHVLPSPPGSGRNDTSIRESPPKVGHRNPSFHTRWKGGDPVWGGRPCAPRDSHSSLWSGRHWGESLSSRTPSGAHTQGSWVSHCHLASWA